MKTLGCLSFCLWHPLHFPEPPFFHSLDPPCPALLCQGLYWHLFWYKNVPSSETHPSRPDCDAATSLNPSPTVLASRCLCPQAPAALCILIIGLTPFCLVLYYHRQHKSMSLTCCYHSSLDFHPLASWFGEIKNPPRVPSILFFLTSSEKLITWTPPFTSSQWSAFISLQTRLGVPNPYTTPITFHFPSAFGKSSVQRCLGFLSFSLSTLMSGPQAHGPSWKQFVAISAAKP